MPDTKFGVSQLKIQTPAWANWVFRISFLLTAVILFTINGDQYIALQVKVQISNYLKGFDLLIWGLSKMFGITVDTEILSEEKQRLQAQDKV